MPRGKEPSPAALSAKDRDGRTELDRVRAHLSSEASQKPFEFAAYKAAEVRERLDALFHGKCAYCETYYAASAPVDIEHFRPKGAVSEDEEHPGYWWLAMEWENLLPSCIDCNRKRKQKLIDISASPVGLRTNSRPLAATQSGKKDSFPLASGSTRLQAESVNFADEHALLLNPCEDDPDEFLVFLSEGSPPVSLVAPRAADTLSERGAASIQIYGLNRIGLVQERTRVLRRLVFLGNLVLDLAEMIDHLDDPSIAKALKGTRAEGVGRILHSMMKRTLVEMREMAVPTQPFSAMAAAWLKDFFR